MIQRVIVLLGIAVALLLVVLAYSYLRPPATATQPIQSVPLPTVTEAAALESAPIAAAPAATPTAAAVRESQADPAAAEGAESSGELLLFQIVPEQSEVRFVIDEVLNGAPKTVVGVTTQVAGQIEIDLESPPNSRIGVIQVNARTLVTDNSFRNRALMNQILDTGRYEYVTFTPTALVGLPERVTVGAPFHFQIIGDLTVRETTRQVTFDASVTPTSAAGLAGVARTTVLYADFGLRIPSVRSVASVDDEVVLEIDFVAAPIS